MVTFTERENNELVQRNLQAAEDLPVPGSLISDNPPSTVTVKEPVAPKQPSYAAGRCQSLCSGCHTSGSRQPQGAMSLAMPAHEAAGLLTSLLQIDGIQTDFEAHIAETKRVADVAKHLISMRRRTWYRSAATTMSGRSGRHQHRSTGSTRLL